MKKDLDQLFSKSIETYYFLLAIVVIIKLLGGNYFEIVYTNETINKINDIIAYWRLENIWYAITLYIYGVIIVGITCNDCSKQLKTYMLLCIPLIIVIQSTKQFTGGFGILIDYFYLYLLGYSYLKIHKKPVTKTNFFNYISIMILYTIVQIFSMIIRSQDLSNVVYGFYVTFILNLDCLLVMLIIYNLYFKKGGTNLCQMVVSYGLQKLISLKRFLANLHVSSHVKREPLSKEEKITRLIFYPLYLLWNMFTMLVIVLIAFLNNALVEALFITIAFWINKHSFGKPFHFQSVAVCFAFSSFTYYVLTRITFSVEASFFVSIFLGVGLSYVTSHFIKKNFQLYKGMSEELLYKTVMQVTEDPIVMNICRQYYCDRLTDVKIASMVGYSIDSVRKKRQKVNKDLRSLKH